MNVSSSAAATPWCSPAGYWARRIARPLSPCAASWKRPSRICRTLRTQMRSCTSTWTSPPWSWGPSVAATPSEGRPLSAWRAWTLWPQWRSTSRTATSSVPSTRPTGPSPTPWRAWTCRCRPPQPRCLYSRPATPLRTQPRLPPRPSSCWRTGKGPEKCPGSEKVHSEKMTRLVAADVCEIRPRATDCKTPDVPHVHLHNYTHTHTTEGIPRKWRIISFVDRLASRMSTFPTESEI